MVVVCQVLLWFSGLGRIRSSRFSSFLVVTCCLLNNNHVIVFNPSHQIGPRRALITMLRFVTISLGEDARVAAGLHLEDVCTVTQSTHFEIHTFTHVRVNNSNS